MTMELGTLLSDRYRIKDTLGKSRLADTFLAVDERANTLCVVKRLSVSCAYSDAPKEIQSFSGSDSAKIIELFEREGSILAHLDHPRIPKLIDYFSIESEYDTHLYLVQEYINAPSLAELVAAGRHFTEREAIEIALQLTEVLDYLHRRYPPLVHRDIKPSNILYSDDGEVFLIDFGAVKNHLVLHEADGATIVGTYGYMPLEQFQGTAVPASDVYSLGMTLVAVLSHIEPADFPKRGTRLDFRRHVRVSTGFGRVLAKMIEPDLQRRYGSASRVRRDLEAALVGGRRPNPRRLIAAGIAALVVLGGYFALDAPSVQRNASPRAAVRPAAQPIESIVPVAARDGVLSLNIYESFKYVDRGWPMGLSVGQTNAGGLDTRPYEALRAEPDYKSPQVYYGYLPLGNSSDSRITFVIDELERPTWVVYVDKNNNEDLTDDGPPHQNQGTLRLAASLSLSVDVVTPSGLTITRPYDLWFWVNERDGVSRPESLFARFYATCHYSGRVDLGGRVFTTVAYEFRQHNALFAENGIYIDLNEDGELDDSEHFLHGEPLRVGGEVYTLELTHP